MGDKAAETTHNISSTFGSGNPSEHTVPGWFRKFRKGDEGIEVEERGVWPSEADNDQLRTSWKLILLELHKKFPKNSTSTLLVVLHLRHIGKVTKLDKWVPHELTKTKQKTRHFKVPSSLVPRINNLPFLGWIMMCDKKWILYKRTTGNEQLRGWLRRSSKTLPKAKLASRKRSWSLVVCCLSDPFQLSKAWRNHYISEVRSANWWDLPQNCNACGCHWSTERALFFSTMMLDFMLHYQYSKSWMSWTMKFCLICHIHLISCQLTMTSFNISVTLQGKCCHNQQKEENVFKSLLNPKTWIFMLQE